MSKPSLLDQLLTATEMCGRLRERVYATEENHRNTEAELRDARNDVHNLEARIKDLESAKPPTQVTVPFRDSTEAPAPVEDSWVTVQCTLYTDRRIDMIKSVRILTGIGFKEAKDFVEGTPTRITREALNAMETRLFQISLPSAFIVIE